MEKGEVNTINDRDAPNGTVSLKIFAFGLLIIVVVELLFAFTMPSSILSNIFHPFLTILVIVVYGYFFYWHQSRTEKALKESEIRFNAVVENALEWIWELDVHGRYTYVSPVAEKLLGYKQDEIIGRRFCEFYHPEDRKELREEMTQVFESGANFRDNIKRCLHKDGRTVWFSSSGVPIIDEKGSFTGYRGVSQDITDRKTYEEELEALYKHAVELTSAKDLDEVAESTLNAIEQSLGYDYLGFGFVEGDRIVFRNVKGGGSITHLDMDGPGITVNAVRTGKTQLVNDVRLDPDYISARLEGDHESLSELAVPFKVGGRVVGVINLESDRGGAFSEQNRRLMETFAQHISSGMTIIQQREEILQKVQELERSNRSLDDYTYSVSHDLKAPLRSIQAFTHLLLDGHDKQLDARGVDFLERVWDASKRMEELIDDLLVLSSVGRKYTETEFIDLNELIREIRIDLDAQLMGKGARIIAEELPTVEAQRVWMRQLLANLIENGVKFNKSPEPRVWVDYEERQEGYVFSVRDNGIGIEERHIDSIFNLFQRLHTKDEYPGTGSGLAICKKIVESYGGKIWVKSNPDEGATFLFTYPKAGQKAMMEPDHTQGRATGTKQAPDVDRGTGYWGKTE